jgi:hypothetical protein
MRDVNKIIKDKLNEKFDCPMPYSISPVDKIETLGGFRVKTVTGAIYEYKIIKKGVDKFFEIHFHNDKKYPYDMQWWAALEDGHLVWRVYPHKGGKEMAGNGYGFEPNFHAVLVRGYREKIAQLIEKHLGKQCAQDFLEKVKGVV